jgi:hypothetical protein
LRSDSSPPTRTRVAILVEHDLPVTEQQGVARADVLGQVLVGAAHPFGGTRLRVERGVEHEGLAFLQHDLLVAEALDADFGSAKIEQHPDASVGALGGLAHQCQPPPPILHGSVRGVQPHDVQPGVHHVRQDSDVVGRRTDGRHDLRSSQHESAACALLEGGDGG